MEAHQVHINRGVKAVELMIFNIRWILPLFYLGLVVAMVLYGYSYLDEIIHLATQGFRSQSIKLDDMKLIVLDLVDTVMVANLVKMIIAGSYHSFISKKHGYANEAISSGMLKIKIQTSIIVVGSIHLLKEFVTHTSWAELSMQLFIYGAFLASGMVLGVLEYLHIKGEVLEADAEHRHAAHDSEGHSSAHRAATPRAAPAHSHETSPAAHASAPAAPFRATAPSHDESHPAPNDHAAAHAYSHEENAHA